MERLIGVVFAVIGSAIISKSAYAGNATMLTDPVTKDTGSLLTHAKGTYVKHANGLAGYIVLRLKDSALPKDAAAQHEYYVLDYEKRGYVRQK